MSDSATYRRQPARLPVPGILQARTLEWVAISFSNAWKWKVKVKSLSRVWLERPHGLQPTRLLRPWDFLGKSTGVGCHCLLRTIGLGTAYPVKSPIPCIYPRHMLSILLPKHILHSSNIVSVGGPPGKVWWKLWLNIWFKNFIPWHWNM